MAYSDAEVTEALIKLAVNRYDFDKTAQDTGISAKTLRRWDKSAPKKTVPALLERAIERMLMVIPEGMTGHDWAVALGILMDKWLLVNNRPTARTERTLTQVLTMRDDEINAILAEADRILEDATGGGFSQGDDPTA